MADPSKYLLPMERVAISTRRHWAYLAADTLQAVVLLAIGVLLARILNGVDFAGTCAVAVAGAGGAPAGPYLLSA